METNPRCIFFSDFDGTLTLQDSNDYLTDNLGFGPELRRKANIDILEGREKLRDTFKGMLDSVKTPYDECIKLLCDKIQLDPHFKDFFQWTLENNIPVIVLSAGTVEIIRALLVHMLGPDAHKIQVVGNDIRDRPGMHRNQPGGWELIYHDDSEHGHDKSLTIKPYANLPADKRPMMFYAGDGVSDLSAARETDLLFAKAGRDLVTYCEREGLPFTTFEDWSTIFHVTRDIYDGKITIPEVTQPYMNGNHLPNGDHLFNGDHLLNGDHLPNGDHLLNGNHKLNGIPLLNGNRLPN